MFGFTRGVKYRVNEVISFVPTMLELFNLNPVCRLSSMPPDSCCSSSGAYREAKSLWHTKKGLRQVETNVDRSR